MITLYVFVLFVGAVGAVAYLLLFFSHVPGAKEERLGKLEELRAELGKWVEASRRDGMVREERHLLVDPSGSDQTRVLVQARLRSEATGEIVEVLPETSYRRRRVRS